MKIGRASMTATWLLLFIVLGNTRAWSLPAPCYSPKYDAFITASVDQYWRDFQVEAWWRSQLCAESQFNPNAVSAVGAMGLAQLMPATYEEIVRTLKWDSRITAFNPERAINAGAYYQARCRVAWSVSGRTGADRNRLGAACYNAGLGNILKAQAACHDARLWEVMSACLPQVTGQFARETITYVDRITQYVSDFTGK